MTDELLENFSSAWGSGARTNTVDGQVMRGVNDKIPDAYANEWLRVFGPKNAPYIPWQKYRYKRDAIVEAEERFQAALRTGRIKRFRGDI